MAEYIAGSQELFVEQMNKRAKELGINDTRELMINHPSITNYTTIWMDSLRGGESELVNTNKLLRNYEGCTGLKTGSTSLAHVVESWFTLLR